MFFAMKISSITDIIKGFLRALASIVLMVFPVYLLSMAIGGGALEKKHSGEIFKELKYIAEDGQEKTSLASENKLTAIHFWATWCKPCVLELPEVNEAQKRYNGRRFKIIALSEDAVGSGAVRKFFTQQNIDALEVNYDPKMKNFRKTRADGLPTTIFVNEKGEEVARRVGMLGWENDEVKEFIEKQLK